MQSTSSPPPTSAEGRPGPFGLSEHPLLPMAEVGKVNRKGQLRGTATGIFSGVLGALFVRNGLKRSPNATVMSGLLIGSLTGYISSTIYVKEGLRILEEKKQSLRSTVDRDTDLMNTLDMQAGQNPNFEAGVAGLHEFQDRSHSTRGDH
ncbi:uncharacterized protein FA14DRAFT_171979 [Meira miltonrushii]|uniref:Uncharacterized protein n=1 Tax=Meira miltonrushii TaxID=1280837 RepID=A0A316VCN8_9BASI|nr:uncharacterized protein FA14DRAFT_171979 [Meira miltonrushii]PWN35322.1 hypothetical protein FA14DRAFT_171979 [Meira miltonrushii]